MSTKQFLVDAATRHSVFVQRFAGGQAKKTLAYIKKLQTQLAGRIADENLTDFSSQRAKAMYNDLSELTKAMYRKMGLEIQEDMIEFAKYEVEFTGVLADESMRVVDFNLPSNDMIEAAIKTNPMSVAPGVPKDPPYTIGTALRKFETAKALQVVQTVKDGVVLGRTSQQIIKDLKNVVGNIQRHNAEALVRTITNHVATTARMTTLKENADVLEGYQVVATLDNLTTLICAGLDGKIFPMNAVRWPPFHWNCRSTLIPVVKKKFGFGAEITGDRPSVGDKGVQEVGTNTTFGGWLKDQNATFKKEYFSKFPDGESKYKLFEKGGLPIESFTDAKGAMLTLKQLKAVDKIAFEKAGI